MAFGLNIFKTVTADLTTGGATIYTAPIGYSAIVLMAQISNITANAEVATMSVVATDSTETELIKDFQIPGNDAASALTGKLVLETGYSVVGEAGSNGVLKLVLSILESKN
jgi:hypothetical protein